MAQKKKRDKIGDALLKVALGCTVEEVTEEYAEIDGELKLTKRRETKKDIPPDLKAVQMLLSENGEEELSSYSDEQLEEERQRLLSALKAEEGKSQSSAKKTAEKGANETVKRKRPAPRKPRRKTAVSK